MWPFRKKPSGNDIHKVDNALHDRNPVMIYDYQKMSDLSDSGVSLTFHYSGKIKVWKTVVDEGMQK